MNDHTYLAIADVDPFICAYLDPPSVLTMSEVNVHYAQVLRPLQQAYNQTENDFTEACAIGNKWIATYLFHVRIDRPIRDLRKPMSAACLNGHSLIAHWLLDISVQYKLEHSFSSSRSKLFETSCDRGNFGAAQLIVDISNRLELNIKSLFTDYNFDSVCTHGSLPMAQWFANLSDTSLPNLIKSFVEKYSFSSTNAILKDKALIQWICTQNIPITGGWLVYDICTTCTPDIIQIVFEQIPTPIIYDEAEIFLTGIAYNNHKGIMRWFIDTFYLSSCHINTTPSEIFVIMCRHSDMDDLKYLIELSHKYFFDDEIDIDYISVDTYWWDVWYNVLPNNFGTVFSVTPFACVCLRNNLAMAQWLLEVGEQTNSKIDIHRDNDFVFRAAHYAGFDQITQWLLSLEDTYGPFDQHNLRTRKQSNPNSDSE